MTRAADDPLYAGELRARADLTLAAILRALLVVLPVLVLASVLSGAKPEASLLLGLTLPYAVALFILQRRGHFALCVYAIVFGLIAFTAVIAVLYGSVRSVGTVGQVAAITVGGIFLGRRALIAAATFSVCSLGALIYAQNAGWLPTPNYRVTASHWVIYSLIIAAVALILSYMRALLIDVVRRLGNELEERRSAEQSLQQSETKYSAVFATTPDPIAIAREADAVTLEVNAAWLRATGYARGWAVGRSALDLGLWAEPAQRQEAVAQLNTRGIVSNFPARFRVADGRMIEVLLSGAKVILEGESCIVWSWRDMTEQTRAETEKRQALERFEQVFAHSPESITISRLSDGKLLAVNDAWLQHHGIAREQAVGRTTVELGLWGTEDREPVREKLARDGRIMNHVLSLRKSDGSLRETLLSLVVIEMEGEPCIIGMGRDISEQRRAEQALRESEHKYRSLFQAATDCILVIDRGGRLLDINEFGCRSLGYSREELVGGSFARILDETKLLRLLPRPAAVRLEHRTVRAEQDVRAKDGKLHAVEFTASPLPDGNILAIVRDVTERRRHEKLLENIAKGVSPQTGAEFFRTLVQSLCRELPADMAFIGEIVETGDRVRTAACCSDGVLTENFEYALAGSPCVLAIEKRGTVIHPDRAAELFPEDKGLARRGIAGYVGTSLFDAEGKGIGILVALTRKPIERKEFFISVLEIFAARAAAEVERARADAAVRALNVSLERRVVERTAELESANRDLGSANRDLDSFGYSVSHDLRSPLGAINGFAYLLRSGEAERLSSDGRHLLLQIENNATQLISLVDGLLEFSRLGRNRVIKVPVPMVALVAEVINEVRAEHSGPRTEFCVAEVPDTWGDPVLLRQVWKNLIGNAVKYSRERDPARVEVGYEESAGAYFVRDNGAGFDMQHASRLFGVFERLHSNGEFEGTGVGLAIVQRIVQRHGGDISGEGLPGRGATFRFTLPAG